MSAHLLVGASALREVLAKHERRVFMCSCGERIRYRPLPDPGEAEAAWAKHVVDALIASGLVQITDVEEATT